MICCFCFYLPHYIKCDIFDKQCLESTKLVQKNLSVVFLETVTGSMFNRTNRGERHGVDHTQNRTLQKMGMMIKPIPVHE